VASFFLPLSSKSGRGWGGGEGERKVTLWERGRGGETRSARGGVFGPLSRMERVVRSGARGGGKGGKRRKKGGGGGRGRALCFSFLFFVVKGKGGRPKGKRKMSLFVSKGKCGGGERGVVPGNVFFAFSWGAGREKRKRRRDFREREGRGSLVCVTLSSRLSGGKKGEKVAGRGGGEKRKERAFAKLLSFFLLCKFPEKKKERLREEKNCFSRFLTYGEASTPGPLNVFFPAYYLILQKKQGRGGENKRRKRGEGTAGPNRTQLCSSLQGPLVEKTGGEKKN